MRFKHTCLALLLALFALRIASAQKAVALPWDAVQQLAPGTPLWVTMDPDGKVAGDQNRTCIFLRATQEKLICRPVQSDTDGPNAPADKEFGLDRDQIRAVQIVPRSQRRQLDDSRGTFDFMMGFNGSFSPGPGNQPDIAVGGRIGRLISLDLDYDCIQGHSGFSVQNTAILPVARYPQFKPGVHQNFVKLFIEPGVGYRLGQGPFGAYTSAGALLLLTSHWSGGTPYVEYQHRFPFGNPWEGDNRVTVGYMVVISQANSSGF